ncbi:MAG: ABC transporter ATP-binding protein [Bacteroidales bacterium]|nr:ABC transporter ATP-binding protein [Lentimicrobiaceae bacterium]MDD5694169.1 ABC transporter ATP-binding protein [Bacteroidales bacterium]
MIDIQDLTVEFRDDKDTVTAVDRISFTIEAGKILGIVGESGSGKTVTALSIMRLIQPPEGKITQGRILYRHPDSPPIDLLTLTEKEMRSYRGNRISMIFQEPMTSLNPVYTCGKQVAEAIQLHRKMPGSAARSKTLELFSEVQLPHPEEIYRSYPFQLSGGQRQRVMIAMAVSSHPALLIADEPTTALDVTIQKNIMILLKDLRQRYGMAVLFISHDLGVIREIAESVVVMKAGGIVEAGSADSIFSRPVHPYTRGLLACRPPLDIRLKKLPVASDFMENPDKEISHGSSLLSITVAPEERARHLEQLYLQEPILQVIHLKTYFPLPAKLFSRIRNYRKALDNVMFGVYPGETLGLAGESGCGKTTLGRSILRLIEPTSGQVIYKGRPLLDLPPSEIRAFRKNLQIIFQDPYSSLNPRMTAGMSIMEPMKVHGLYSGEKTRRQKAMELLEKVKLEERHFFRYPHEFSGGQRQRICIARALAVEPEFIICDETVSSLDVSIQAQVLNLLNALKEEFHLTYIFISHDLSVVKFMSDRIIIMKDGKIIEMAEADTLFAHPANPYTRNLIQAIPAVAVGSQQSAVSNNDNQ